MSDHDCHLGPYGHRPITEPDELDLLRGGICPLCLHDMYAEDACIECEHRFDLTDPKQVEVYPLP